MKNIFDLSGLDPQKGEYYEKLFSGNSFELDRIVSFGHPTPPTEWYDQAGDEWVIVLAGWAELIFDDGRSLKLCKGDYMVIEAHEIHRVEQVSEDCIWLAIHT